MTSFFRLLNCSDKGEGLDGAISSLRSGREVPGLVYEIDPRDFGRIPSSPLAYWLPENLAAKFANLPPFESGGRSVKQGVATADDFQFVRLWWEVLPVRILDSSNAPELDVSNFRAWCRERTHQGKRWVPFAKGGDYSPFYSDISTVVDWEHEGQRIKSRINPQSGKPYSNVWQLKQTESEYFFRSGLTWPLRGIHLSVQAVPSGCIFSNGGKLATSVDVEELPALLGIMNSQVFDYFVGVFAGKIGGVQYEVGLIRRVPVPKDTTEGNLGDDSISALAAAMAIDQHDECTHVFVNPPLLFVAGGSLRQRLAAWNQHVASASRTLMSLEERVDATAIRLYGIAPTERSEIERWIEENRNQSDPSEDQADLAAQEAALDAVRPGDDPGASTVSGLLSYCVGCTLGRWDVRAGLNQSLAANPSNPFAPLPVCSPGMLIGPDALPADMNTIVSDDWLKARPNSIALPAEGSIVKAVITDAEYPLEIAWDGIQVDDEEHQRDVITMLRSMLNLLWGEQADAIENEACEMLAVSGLREYFRNPRGFFDAHVKRYSANARKAPVYWLLQSSKRSYGLWLYYHRLDADMLFKALSTYVDPKVQREEGRLADLRKEKTQMRATGSTARQGERAIERQETLIAELRDFRDKLNRVASLGLKPDLDDGVVLNAAPLWELMPWKVAKDYWQELLKGEYAWSSIGKQLRAKKLVAAP